MKAISFMGWVELLAKPITPRLLMGFAALNPSYALRAPIRPHGESALVQTRPVAATERRFKMDRVRQHRYVNKDRPRTDREEQ
jgi:hypothetical protein